jgi:hypothetical protein
MNVLYIWEFSKQDLTSLGIKDMYKAFGTNGDKETIPISFLQSGLMRIALVVGVNVYPSCEFKGFESASRTHWGANIKCTGTGPGNGLVEFDAILDGTGTGGVVRSQKLRDSEGLEVPAIATRFKNSNQAASYAVTANFNRFTNDSRTMFAVAYQYNINKFNAMDVKLQNIVYYRSPVAHYLVATIDVDALLAHKVARRKLHPDKFLSRQNIDKEALEKVIWSIAKQWGVPSEEGLYMEGPDSRGKLRPSFSLFEFTRIERAEKSFDIMLPPLEATRNLVSETTENSSAVTSTGIQAIMVAGDSALTPFWPDGTGANRAILGAKMHVNNLVELFSHIRDQQAPDEDVQNSKAMQNSMQRFRLLRDQKSGRCTRCEFQSYEEDTYGSSLKPACTAHPGICSKRGFNKGPLD